MTINSFVSIPLVLMDSGENDMAWERLKMTSDPSINLLMTEQNMFHANLNYRSSWIFLHFCEFCSVSILVKINQGPNELLNVDILYCGEALHLDKLEFSIPNLCLAFTILVYI